MKRSTSIPATCLGALVLALMWLCIGCGNGGGEGDADAVSDVQDARDTLDGQDGQDVPTDAVPDTPSDPDAAENEQVDGPTDAVQDADAMDAADMGEIEQACIDSGGTVETQSCCIATEDFPNLCTTGPCGCSPENSHDVLVCNCGTGKCFDGTTCVNAT
jgi:hypothetical protein